MDHPLIGFLRRIAESEDAVLVEDQALDLVILIENIGGGDREIVKARHDVRHKTELVAKDLLAQLPAAVLVDH